MHQYRRFELQSNYLAPKCTNFNPRSMMKDKLPQNDQLIQAIEWREMQEAPKFSTEQRKKKRAGLTQLKLHTVARKNETTNS